MTDTFIISQNGTTDMGYVGEVPRQQSYIGSLFVFGSFNGATVKFQISPDDTNWLHIPDPNGNPVSFIQPGMRNLELGTGGLRLRAVTTGATSPAVTVMLKDSN